MACTTAMQEIDSVAEKRRTFRDGMFRQKSMSALHTFHQQAEEAQGVSKRTMMEGMRRQHSMNSLNSPLGALKRSSSQNALFKELVLQVPINDQCDMRESSDLSSFSEANTSSASESEVQVWDALLETAISVPVRPSTTFAELKDQIQSAQGRAGMRILPSHAQVISLGGRTGWADDALVSEVKEAMSSSSSELTVEPLVTELVSFFLASVNNLAARSPASPATTAASLSPDGSPAPHRKPPAAPKASDADADADAWDFFGLGGMEGVGAEGEGGTGKSSSASPSSPLPESPVETPLEALRLSAPAEGVRVPRAGRVVSWLSEGHGLAPLDVEGGGSEASLSARVTPSAAGSEGSVGGCAASYEGASVLAALYAQRDGEWESGEEKRGVLDATLLRMVGHPGDAHATQSHLVMRNAEACLPLLQRLKLGELERLVLEVQSGLRHGHAPEELEAAPPRMDYGELVGGCTGGTYLMRNSKGKPTAIFKPTDEEPYAPANPKGYTGSMDVQSDMRSGIPVGGGAARECAAYLLDHDGRANIPHTAMLRISHSTLQGGADAEVELKVGSLQRFAEHECTVEDVGTSSFPTEAVHAIAMLDVRVFNMDRNSDNVLYVPGAGGGKPSLVPIDHGYILPSVRHLEEVEACWLHWPQAKQPLSAASLAYIAALDADADAALLRGTLALSEESLLTLVLGTALLQKGAAAGLTLHDIGSIMTRDRYDEPSAAERLVAECFERELTGEALRAALVDKAAALVQQRKVTCCFSRMGQGMHRRTNSQCALAELVGGGSDSSDEAQ